MNLNSQNLMQEMQKTKTCTDMSASGTELLTPYTFIMEKPPQTKKKDFVSSLGLLAIVLEIFHKILEILLSIIN